MPTRSVAAEPNQHTIVATTTFNAPRDLLFKIMTDPELIPQWWGPRALTTTVDRMEPRSGGSWRYIVNNPKGDDWIFHGVYHVIEAPERIIFTYEYEAEPWHVSMESYRFEDQDGTTKMTVTSLFQSVEDRDNMLQSDWEDGEIESLERLEELLAKSQVSV
jgi:uncharacterized protein YndB with AHSA1/START domain